MNNKRNFISIFDWSTEEIMNNIEKLKNWTNLDFRKNIKWYKKIKKNNKAIVQDVHLEKMKKWTYDKKKGTIN